MITTRQIEDLARFFKIDRYSIFREYLQLLFLNYLYQHKKATKIYFKGGTAIHFLFHSPRFSEDLDFSSSYEKTELAIIIKEVWEEMKKELEGVKISLLYQGKKSIRFRLKYSLADFKYPFAVRIDFQEKEKPRQTVTSSLITNFPLIFFPVVNHLSGEEMLAEKITALLTRSKGRDVFDLWFMLKKGIKINNRLLKEKLKPTKIEFDKKILIKKVANFPVKKLKSDLDKFLPQPQRKIITVLKPSLINEIK